MSGLVPEAPGAADPGGAEGDGGEVVVTARSREERLLDVPDTITAFSHSQIERVGIDQLNAFVRLTPGLSLVEASQSPGIALINIRGVGQQLQSEAPVAVVIDGVQTEAGVAEIALGHSIAAAVEAEDLDDGAAVRTAPVEAEHDLRL